jgi:hypothetical protein
MTNQQNQQNQTQTRQTQRIDTEISKCILRSSIKLTEICFLAERNVPQPKHGPVTSTTRELEAKLAQVQKDFDEFNRKLAQGEKGEDEIGKLPPNQSLKPNSCRQQGGPTPILPTRVPPSC